MLVDNLLEILRLELSCRPDNNHVGSGSGGNAEELFYIMTHDISIIKSESNEIAIEKSLDTSIINIYVPVHLELERNILNGIRVKLTEYIDRDKNAIECSFDDLIDLDFLKDFVFKSKEIKDLYECVKLTKKLKTHLIENQKQKFTTLDESQIILAQCIGGYSSSIQVLCMRLIIGIRDIIEFSLENYTLSSSRDQSISKLSTMKLMQH